jgi:hypothetical protein
VVNRVSNVSNMRDPLLPVRMYGKILDLNGITLLAQRRLPGELPYARRIAGGSRPIPQTVYMIRKAGLT